MLYLATRQKHATTAHAHRIVTEPGGKDQSQKEKGCWRPEEPTILISTLVLSMRACAACVQADGSPIFVDFHLE